jgi:hypothetical protein
LQSCSWNSGSEYQEISDDSRKEKSAKILYPRRIKYHIIFFEPSRNSQGLFNPSKAFFEKTFVN